MNQRQKEVQQIFLNNEKAVLNEIKGNYADALAEIESRIAILQGRDDADLQHVIYQVEYQKALKKQTEAILEELNSNNFETISEYLAKSYEDGFIGTMYDLQGQGIPLVIPIDQEQVVAAIQHETKLSEGLYAALGKDTKVLSKQIAGEISRGISNSTMFSEMSRNISSYAGISQNNAMRIVRTEGHRIQCKATSDAQWKAKEKGADVVKQWDASLDGKTRDSHRKLDGQIRELDEPFEVDGMTAMEPGGFGDPAEDINCRCALLQRARWALDQGFTKWSPDAPVEISDDGTTQYIKFDNVKDYDQFKEQYMEATKVYDLKFSDISNDNRTEKQKYEDTVTFMNAYNKLPTNVKASIPDASVEFGHDGSACDIANKIIRVGIGADEEDIMHEYGHLIEEYMMNKKDVEEYKKFLTEGLSINDIIVKTYRDDVGNKEDIFVLVGNRFESEYQSRLYISKLSDALNPDGSINTDFMGECISEPFRKYMNNEKISDESRKLIEGAIL